RQGDTNLAQIVEGEADGGIAVRRRGQELHRLVEGRHGVLRGVEARSTLVECVEDPPVNALERCRRGAQIHGPALRAALEQVHRAAESIVGALQIEHPLRRPRLRVVPFGAVWDPVLGDHHLGYARPGWWRPTRPRSTSTRTPASRWPWHGRGRREQTSSRPTAWTRAAGS